MICYKLLMNMLRAIIISLALMLPAIMTAKESYVIQDSPDGPCLVKWIGKESVVDFNRSPALRSVKVIGEVAFEMNNHIRKVLLPEGLTIIRKRASTPARIWLQWRCRRL